MVNAHFATTLPFQLDDVWSWHTRPGALTRLTPPGFAKVIAEPAGGLTDGSLATLQLRYLPGNFGKWTAQMRVGPGTRFEDRATSGPFKGWHHVHNFEGQGSATLMTDEIEFELPAFLPDGGLVNGTLARMMEYRRSQVHDDLAFGASHNNGPLRIAMSGASGLIGTQLKAMLTALGHSVTPIVRGSVKVPGAIAMDAATAWIDEEALAGIEVVIHLAGEPIGGRFTTAHKARILNSRIGPTKLLANAAVRAGSVRSFISASAIGYYGADPAGEMSEDSPAGADFLAQVCRAWEDATTPARDGGLRVVNVRTGIVLTPAGGALAKQLPLFAVGAGGPLAGGKAWQSWITIDDICGIYAHAVLDERVQGPVNGVGPEPATTGEIAKELGRVMHRPSLVPVPRFGVEALYGKQGADLLAHASQRVSAARIASAGYEFRHPRLGQALEHILMR